MNGTLYRSRTDRMILGVCGGLGHSLGIDPTAVRVVAVLFTWLSWGTGLIAYIVLGLFLPEEPIGADRTAPYARPRDAAASGKDVTMADEDGGTQPQEPTTEQVTQEQTASEGVPIPPPPPPVVPQPEYTPPPAGQPAYTPPPAAQPYQQPAPVKERRRQPGLVGGIILIVLGLLFLAQEFIPGLDLGRLWPLILIAIGVAIIFRRR